MDFRLPQVHRDRIPTKGGSDGHIASEGRTSRGSVEPSRTAQKGGTMSKDTNRTRRRVLFAAAGAMLALAVVASPAGAGVGDFFKLGQTNTADATSLLTGTTA